MSRYFRAEDNNIITAKQLNALYEEHINKPLEEAHPYWKEKLFEHIADTTAHHLITRLSTQLERHKKDPKAHWAVVLEIQNFLKRHSHPELYHEVEKDLGGLIEEHEEKGHLRVLETLGKVYISAEPPDRDDIPDNFLWYSPKEGKVFIRKSGEWKELGYSNPFEVDYDYFWALMCAIICSEAFYRVDKVDETIKVLSEKLGFIDWGLVKEIVTSEEYRRLMIGYMWPKDYYAMKYHEWYSDYGEVLPPQYEEDEIDLVDWLCLLAYGGLLLDSPSF